MLALVNRFCGGVSALSRPMIRKNDAKIDIEIERLRGIGGIDVSDAEIGALKTVARREINEQQRIATVLGQTALMLENSADARQIEEDWLLLCINFIRQVPDEEMQSMWARVLAGEANQPGSFSKRCLAYIATLSKSEANLFTELSRFIVHDGERPALAIPHEERKSSDNLNSIFIEHGITSQSLNLLDSIGLVKYSTPFITNNIRVYASNIIPIRYFDEVRAFALPPAHQGTGYQFIYGMIDLTPLGEELSKLAGPSPVVGFFDYLESAWNTHGMIRSPTR